MLRRQGRQVLHEGRQKRSRLLQRLLRKGKRQERISFLLRSQKRKRMLQRLLRLEQDREVRIAEQTNLKQRAPFLACDWPEVGLLLGRFSASSAIFLGELCGTRL